MRVNARARRHQARKRARILSAHIWKFRRNKSRFRAWYTATGLADLANVSRQEMRHWLKSMPILKPRWIGSKKVYYLQDIREAFPELYESLRLKIELDTEAEANAQAVKAFERTGSW